MKNQIRDQRAESRNEAERPFTKRPTLPAGRQVLEAGLFSAFCFLISALPLGAAIVNVPSGGNPSANGDAFQTALNNAACGDTLILQAGVEYGTPVAFVGSGGPIGYPFNLPNKGNCAGNYITIRTSNLSGLPAAGERVSPADAADMPKIVSNTNYPAIEAAQSANYYKLIGLEITNSPTVAAQNGYTPTLVSGPSYNPINTYPHHIVVDQCFIHPIEETTNPNSDYRSATRAVFIDGAEIVVQNSYLSGFTGWYPNTVSMIDSEDVIMVGGPGPLRIINNFLEAWFNNVFTGGGGNYSAYDSTITASDMSHATVTSVTNLAVGDFIALEVLPYTNLRGSSGNYTNGKVTAINGLQVTFTPVAPDSNSPNPPKIGGLARWNGQVISTIEIRRNTFNKRVAWAKYGQCKSFYEVKLGVGMVVDGNIFLDGPGNCNAFGITARNQDGSTPWTTVKNVVVSNNLFYRTGNMTVSLEDDLRTLVPGENITISNNLIYGSSRFTLSYTGGGKNVIFKHNTVRGNTNSLLFGTGIQASETYSDNLSNSGSYWFNCTVDGQLQTCWPGFVQQKNLFINTSASGAPSYTSTDYVVANDAAIGFTNVAACDNGSDYHGCALSAASAHKGKASDGTDPGVNFAALDAALGGVTPPSSGRCDINSDTQVNTLDLQQLVNAILTGTTVPAQDLDGSGQVNAVDVQVLANVILLIRSCP